MCVFAEPKGVILNSHNYSNFTDEFSTPIVLSVNKTKNYLSRILFEIFIRSRQPIKSKICPTFHT